MSAIKTSGWKDLISSLVSNHLRYPILIVTFALASSLCAQERCSEEVKLLLAPTQLNAAVSALGARGEEHGHVYFYDTPAHELLSKGVILRLRLGDENDLTLKFRPHFGETMVTPSSKNEPYKCEVDLNDGVESQSLSMANDYVAAKAPETGEELFRLLSEGQKQLLRDSKVQIDWRHIKRVADIRSTSWTTPTNAPLGKLSLEFWEWSNGSILEVSKKVASDAGQTAYVELRNLAKSNGLALSANQGSKTSIALANNATH